MSEILTAGIAADALFCYRRAALPPNWLMLHTPAERRL